MNAQTEETPLSHLVWIDLEMTGLDLSKDVILEIAVTITDNNLNLIAEGPALIINQPQACLTAMNSWCQKQHTLSGLVAAVQASTITPSDAEECVLSFIQEHCKLKTGILAGNSVFQDRAFLAKYMPSIIEYLHYRIIDVSTVKELARRWYSGSPFVFFKKEETHRAQTDIRESIRELQHYRNHFFVPTPIGSIVDPDASSKGQE